MTLYGYLIITFVLDFLAVIFLWCFHRLQIRHIIEKKGLDKETTFISTGGRKRMLIYSLEADVMRVYLITNVILPKYSLINKEFTVPYYQIERVDLGQGTTTFKLKKTVSLETAVFGYASGSVARPYESWMQVIFTSAATRKAFAEQLTAQSVSVSNVSTSGKRGLKIAFITALILGIFGILLWAYTLHRTF